MGLKYIPKKLHSWYETTSQFQFSHIEVPNQMRWELSDVQLINVQPSKQQFVWRVEICFGISRLYHLQMTDFNGENGTRRHV